MLDSIKQKLEQINLTDPTKYKKAGVLILLIKDKDDEEYKILFTKRSEQLKTHSGEVSFPGGKWEEGDSNLYQTALRESNEEIGIDTSSLYLVGNLSTLYTPVSHFNIHTYVWFSDQYPKIAMNQNEVDEVFEISINELLAEEIISKTPISKAGMNVDVPAFHFSGCVCWGATAMIISELKDILKNI